MQLMTQDLGQHGLFWRMTDNYGCGFLLCHSLHIVCGSSSTFWLSMCCGGSVCWGIQRLWRHSGVCLWIFVHWCAIDSVTWPPWILDLGNMFLRSLCKLIFALWEYVNCYLRFKMIWLGLWFRKGTCWPMIGFWLDQRTISQGFPGKQYLVAP